MTRILLVEDHEMNRKMLTRRLLRRDFEVLEAHDGLEALHMARAEQPDLIIMDMSIPEIDGWEATRRLKEDPATGSIPILGLSAHAMSGDRKKGLDAGCDEYDTKPVDFNRLMEKILLLLEAR